VIRQAILGEGGILGVGLSLVGYEVDHIVELYLVRIIAFGSSLHISRVTTAAR